jgi:hypothetical protein
LTISSSNIIQNLEHSYNSDPFAAIAYHFISFKDETTLDLSILLHRLVSQLFAARPDTPEPLKELQRCYDSGNNPTHQLLEQSLKAVAKGFTRCYIIIDGLDECPNPVDAASLRSKLVGRPREELLGFLNKIRQWQLTSLHVFVSSRPYKEIRQSLQQILPMTEIDLETSKWQTQLKKDIEDFIDEELHLPAFQSLSPRTKDDIKEGLLNKSNGM